MLDAAELKNFYPVVVTPCHDGRYYQNYVQSLIEFTVASIHSGMPIEVLMQQGESLITRARNDLVAMFLENPHWTHLFWIDADIGFSPQAAFRLLLSGYDIAAGVYPLKGEHWPSEGVPAGTTKEAFDGTYTRYTVNTEASPDTGIVEINVQPDGFIRLTQAPTGFMVIKRAVFERLMKAYPDLRYKPNGADKGLHYRFFDVSIDPVTHHYLSEDYHFCHLWRDLGESVYVDANSNLSHQGSKLYRGNFAWSLQSALPNAIGAPAGAPMVLHGGAYLKSNTPKI